MPRGWGISGQLPALLPLAAVLAVTLLVYFPVTRVYFHDDDFTHFFVMSNRGPWYLAEETGQVTDGVTDTGGSARGWAPAAGGLRGTDGRRQGRAAGGGTGKR